MSADPAVLVTGANGFIGRALCAHLLARGKTVHGAARKTAALPGGVRPFSVPGVDGSTPWKEALDDCSAVVHLAARVHMTRDVAADPAAEFRRVNTLGTLNLARQASAAGVRRFVFLSSIGVNGSQTSGCPFRAGDAVAPQTPYARSKHEAEQELRGLAERTGMQVVIVRPPLVYGANAPGNFGTLLRWLRRGVPLPLGAVHNRRSLVSLDNLVDLLNVCLDHPAAANHTFLVSDGEDLSTTDLLRRLGGHLGIPVRLLPVPASLMGWGAGLLGKKSLAQSLLGDLRIDIQKTRHLLGWTPPIGVDEGLRRAARRGQP